MRILIATSRFNDFAGSEITVFEYAQELSNQGHEVSIASFYFSDVYSALCQENGINISVIDDEKLIGTSWDIIWVFHAVTYYALFSKHQYKTYKVVFSSLSHYEPLESPPVENIYIDHFTTNSYENLAYFKESYPDYSSRVTVLPNSIPRGFLNITPRLFVEKKLIIVSNHMPDELTELVNLLRENEWVVDIYGIGHNHKLITPDDLVSYSACITIGKTVQYCLGLKIPVFCYDRFGGPGWINKNNIDLAEKFNFSGRCSHKKMSAEVLLSLFSDEFIPNREECADLFIIAKERFYLPSNISKILSQLIAHFEIKKNSNITTKHILEKIVDIYLRDQNSQTEYKAAWEIETAKREEVETQLLDVHKALHEQNSQKEYKTAWEIETAKREEVEIKLLEIHKAFHEKNCQEEYKIAWQAETAKREEMESKLLKVNYELQQCIESQQTISLQALNSSMKTQVSELENKVAELNQDKTELIKKLDIINHSLSNFRGVITLALSKFLNKIKSSNNKDSK